MCRRRGRRGICGSFAESWCGGVTAGEAGGLGLGHQLVASLGSVIPGLAPGVSRPRPDEVPRAESPMYRGLSYQRAFAWLGHPIPPTTNWPSRYGSACEVKRRGLRAYQVSQPVRCWCGENGKRGSFARYWAKALAGSNPVTRTAVRGTRLTRRLGFSKLAVRAKLPRSPFRYDNESRVG